MCDIHGPKILLVDDEPSIREIMTLVLNVGGYEVSTAIHGLDAIQQLRLSIPDIILSDLNMPEMSGFEFLSVVRLRFPSIPVIAFSGGYDSSVRMPDGVMADVFYSKGRWDPEEVLRVVAELIQTPVSRATNDRQWQPASLQAPRVAKNPKGDPYLFVTCTDCLREFPLDAPEKRHGILGAECPFCAARIRFLNDFGRSVAYQRTSDAVQALAASTS